VTLELRFRRGEQLLGKLEVPVHRAADAREHEHFDAVAALGPDLDVEVELVARAGLKK
jgi:hypothetical protein